MKFDLKITKIDIITMVLLSIVFFSMTAWNVGAINAPTTTWQSTQPQSFYIDLGSNQQVLNMYFFVRTGNASVEVSSGSPGDWSYIGNYSLQSRDTDYSVPKAIWLNVDTQYLLFTVKPVNFDSTPMFANWGITNPTDQPPSPYIQVTELGVENPGNQQIPIANIVGVNGTDSTLPQLVDEQSSLEIPPTYMSKMYFDEVYFARSAVNILNHQIPHERTHPSLGKLIQTAGVATFGVTPFGWRIMGVIFATLMVPLMYLLGKKLFGTWIGGFSAAFLISFDFMHFTMARLGTADTYVVFFSLFSQLFFLVYFMNVIKSGWKQTSVLPLFLAVVFFALGFSTKWVILWSTLGLLALLVAVRFKDILKMKGKSLGDKYVAFFDHPFLLLLGFVGVVALIYFITYIPEMLMGDSFPTIINLNLDMYTFHSTLTSTDTYAAPWWSWPFLVSPTGYVPRWLDISTLPNNTVSTISIFGNPALYWIGFACILVLTEIALHGTELVQNLKGRVTSATQRVSIRGSGWDIPAIYIVVVFFFSWLPYVLISRVTYIYHYYLSVPLLCLGITYFINKYWHKPLGKVAAVAIFAAVVVMFLLFYPVISGAPAASETLKSLEWFRSWDFGV